jgi:pimeloyl-ACP methyl ester carboxylesterase
MEFTHHYDSINGLRYHYVTAGRGPALLFLHGFPDLWRSWEPIMRLCVQAGFRVIAPDLRGFGETESQKPGTATAFDVLGDMIALLKLNDCDQVGLIGHDWGGELAWHLALLRPDRFAAIAALSVPYVPRGSQSLPAALRAFGPPDLYMLYFLEEGLAEQELNADPETFLRRVFYANHGMRPGPPPTMRLSANGRLIDALDEPPPGFAYPAHFDLAHHIEAFKRTGFSPALDTYRSLHRTWELTAGWADKTVTVPALYIGGDKDIVLNFPGMRECVESMTTFLPQARSPHIFQDVGHFIQLERPTETAALLIEFFAQSLPRADARSQRADLNPTCNERIYERN